MKPLFRWIHLSDIHFGAGDKHHGFDRQQVMDAILLDIENHEAARSPDAIFVTGDIAFSAQTGQYDQAVSWFVGVAEAAKTKVDRLRFVPGNHDVDRVAAARPGIRAVHAEVRAEPRKLDEFLEDTDEVGRLGQKLAAYRGFVRSSALQQPDTRSAGIDWFERLEIGGHGAIHVAGLSSVWLSDAGDGCLRTDRSDVFVPNLVIGKGPLRRTLEAVEQGDLLFVLTHHPREWLHPDSANWFEQSLALSRTVHIHLCGHVHQAAGAVQTALGMSDKAVRFTAGAAHGDLSESHSYGYAWGAVRWSEDEERWEIGWAPRVYVPNNGGMRPNATQYNLDPEGYAWAPIQLSWPAPKGSGDSGGSDPPAPRSVRHASQLGVKSIPVSLEYAWPLRLAAGDLRDRFLDIAHRDRTWREHLGQQFHGMKGALGLHKYNPNHVQSPKDFQKSCLGGEFHYASATLYRTAVYLCRAHSGKTPAWGDEELLQQLRSVRDALGGPYGIWEDLQDPAGEGVLASDGRMMNLPEFCRALTFDQTAAVFLRPIDYFRDIYLKTEEELGRIVSALGALAGTLDDQVTKARQ